jgi:hypothetical protein
MPLAEARALAAEAHFATHEPRAADVVRLEVAQGQLVEDLSLIHI